MFTQIKNNKYFIKLSYLLIVITSFVISLLFYKHQKVTFFYDTNRVADAIGYINIAKSLFIKGTGAVRTYGYPFLLYLFNFIVPLKKTFSSSILIVQYLIYFISSVCAARALTKNDHFRLLIIAGLLLNIYILSYVSVTLTETLSISLLLILISIFWGLKKTKIRTFLLAFISAYAVEVRPANLWLYGFILIIFLLECIDEKEPKDIFVSLAIWGFTTLAVFIPQIYNNYLFFKKITFLPAMGLGQVQYEWGKQSAHISFSFLPIPIANVMPNPFMIASLRPFYWFSIDGFSYLLFKILLVFSHNTLFVYQNISEFSQKILIFISSFTVYFGFLGIFFQAKKIDPKKLRAIWIGLVLCILLHIFSGLEDRFTFAIYLLLFPFAIYQFAIFLKEWRYKLILPFIIFFLFMNLMNAICHALTPAYIQSVQAGFIS